MGILVCAGMIVALDPTTLISALVWMVIGLLVYFGYSKKHSKLSHL
jgi:APA family basic amino acid/polyamine antiporter